MYLSYLLIDVGENSDRPRPGRLWLRNLYRVHQRLCMAFPSEARKSEDVDFLKPFRQEDFGIGQVHVPREPKAGFLFRIDPQPGCRVVIIVQSAVKPDWDYAFHNARFLLAAAPEIKSFDPSFSQGERFRFRLVANPTKRFSKNSLEMDGQLVAEKWVGKRVPVPGDRYHEWLAARSEKGGFSVDKDSTAVLPTYVYINKTLNDSGQRLRSVRYDGVLKINVPSRFQVTLIRGIGPGKAFGFGLLSVARVNLRRPAEAT